MYMRYVRTIILLLCVAVSMMGQSLKPAGTTIDQATRVTDTTALSIQSGTNFVRFFRRVRHELGVGDFPR